MFAPTSMRDYPNGPNAWCTSRDKSERTDTVRPRGRKQKQSLAHSGPGAVQTCSKRPASRGASATWVDWCSSPAESYPLWRDSYSWRCWRCWRWLAGPAEHCPQWSWTRVWVEGCRCQVGWTGRTRTPRPDLRDPSFLSRRTRQSRGDPFWLFHCVQVVGSPACWRCLVLPPRRCPRCLWVEKLGITFSTTLLQNERI